VSKYNNNKKIGRGQAFVPTIAFVLTIAFVITLRAETLAGTKFF